MRRGVETAKREKVDPIKKMVGPLAPSKRLKMQNRIASLSMPMIAVFSFVVGLLVAVFLMEYARGELRQDFVAYSDKLQMLLKDL